MGKQLSQLSDCRVLVTGAAGFIGSHIALRTNSLGIGPVFGVDNFDEYYDSSFKRRTAELLGEAGITVVDLDLLDITKLESPQINLIFHSAAQPGISAATTLETYLRNNVWATQHLLQWAKQLPCLELMVNLSTSSVYGLNATVSESTPPAPASNYGVTKLAAEQLCLSEFRQNKFPTCSCRMFSVFGPRERPDKLLPKIMKAAQSSHPVPIFDGSEQHVRSFSFVDDIVDGLIEVVRRRSTVIGEIYNIGTPATYTTADVLECFQDVAGLKLDIERLPPRHGDQLATAAIIDKAAKKLQYNPDTSLETGIQKTWEWFQQEQHLMNTIQ